ncbi:MAG: hypothetical protein P9X24_17045 [Candidatus Hatepunaea meridiana]|nr:hypothetical protein [Candidatus Hatepunaea meridiana]
MGEPLDRDGFIESIEKKLKRTLKEEEIGKEDKKGGEVNLQ